MRLTLLSFMLLIVLGLGCGPGQAPAEQSAEATPKISRDALRQLYAQLKATDTDTLPLRQIQEQDKLYPVDEAPLDTGFYVFRQQLQRAVQQHDVFALLDAVSKDIKVSGAKEPGVAGLVSYYGLTPEATDTLPIWSILNQILENGGTFSEGRKVFTAPYYASTWPSQYPPASHAAIVGSGVRIRSVPSLNSSIVKTVSYDLVRYIETTDQMQEIGGEEHPWVAIELAEGQKGFVYGKFVARPTGFRARFEQTGPQQWVMTQLLNSEQ